VIELAQIPDSGGEPRRKSTRRWVGWLMMQILSVIIRHLLAHWWYGNGPT
jgi:hypothetical protein